MLLYSSDTLLRMGAYILFIRNHFVQVIIFSLELYRLSPISLYIRDGSVGPVSLYREHFNEIPW